LAEFLASQGFAVLQPTHLSSRSLGIPMTGENIRRLFLDSRCADMTQVLDRLDEIGAALPFPGKGRLDRSKVAVIGHSLGGLTASHLLGATNTDPRDGTTTKAVDKRISAGVIIAAPGTAGGLSKVGAGRLAFHNVDFSTMHTPALVLWGDKDGSELLTVRGAKWHEEPYALAPGPKASFMVKGAKHGMGGVSGWDAAECEDESPERLAAVMRVVSAYLKSQLVEGDDTWTQACAVLAENETFGKVESK
jgi:predicted dienelactone hydrolase